MNLLEIHILRSHLRATESELSVGPRNLYCNKISRGFQWVVKLRTTAPQSPSLWENKT